MYLTGFADEAAADLDGQIRATKALGWDYIESRNIDGRNIHDLSDAEFDVAYGKLQDAGVKINCFGSAIANWGKRIDQPFDSSLDEAKRAIPRMRRLGTKLIRVMSFAVLEDRDPNDQMEDERFRRVRELQEMFADAGLGIVHENCMNYGGMGWKYTLRLIENVPDLKLVYDTGNPVTSYDRGRPKPWQTQSRWEFYSHVREHVAYVHIKDSYWDYEAGRAVFVFPGYGEGDIRPIVRDLIARGYDGGISIEPHIAVVFHDASVQTGADARFNTYVEYGRRMAGMIEEIKSDLASGRPGFQA